METICPRLSISHTSTIHIGRSSISCRGRWIGRPASSTELHRIGLGVQIRKVRKPARTLHCPQTQLTANQSIGIFPLNIRNTNRICRRAFRLFQTHELLFTLDPHLSKPMHVAHRCDYPDVRTRDITTSKAGPHRGDRPYSFSTETSYFKVAPITIHTALQIFSRLITNSLNYYHHRRQHYRHARGYGHLGFLHAVH